MRDYAKVCPKGWHGDTLKALRKKGTEALLVGLYLMTSPSSNMLGLFTQPLLYMAHETGLGEEGARKGLDGCIEAGFCSYDEASEVVWVHEMAKYQIAPVLKESDLRCKGVQKDYDTLPNNPFLGPFFDYYAEAFHMTARRDHEEEAEDRIFFSRTPLQGATQDPTKPRTRAGERTGAGDKPSASSPAKLPTCPYDEIVGLYREVLPELPDVRVMDDDRKKGIRKRWEWVLTTPRPDGTKRADCAAEALQWFRDYFELARENDFLMGRSPRTGEHKNWKCDIDFLMTTKGLKHVIEKTE